MNVVHEDFIQMQVFVILDLYLMVNILFNINF